MDGAKNMSDNSGLDSTPGWIALLGTLHLGAFSAGPGTGLGLVETIPSRVCVRMIEQNETPAPLEIQPMMIALRETQKIVEQDPVEKLVADSLEQIDIYSALPFDEAHEAAVEEFVLSRRPAEGRRRLRRKLRRV
jgi:hypothetical protein